MQYIFFKKKPLNFKLKKNKIFFNLLFLLTACSVNTPNYNLNSKITPPPSPVNSSYTKSIENYPKVSPTANKVYNLRSNKHRTHFFVDGEEVAIGRRVKILIDNHEHTIVAQPEGCIAKEEFIQPPYDSYSPLSFTYLMGECKKNNSIEPIGFVRKKENTGTNIPPQIEINLFNVTSRGGRYTTTKKQVLIKGKVSDNDGISELKLNGETLAIDGNHQFIKAVNLVQGINRIDLIAEDNLHLISTKTIIVEKKIPLVTKSGKDSQERRWALVIGNSNYNFNTKLRNPVHDAEDMSNALSLLNFEVTTKLNASQEEMEVAISNFGSQLQSGDVGLFYYAGHGVQVEGKNYLIPIDADLKRQKDVRYKAVNVGQVLDEMDYAGNGLNIIILDACRDNPLPRNLRSGKRGLARVNAPRGTLVAFSTSPGSTAQDGEGRNGLYTKHLLNNINKPNITLEQVFKKALQDVDHESKGEQTPWVSSSFTGDFYFNRSEK